MGERVAALFHRLFADPDAPRPITDRHTQCLLAALSTLSALPVGLPRFFFQSLQVSSSPIHHIDNPKLNKVDPNRRIFFLIGHIRQAVGDAAAQSGGGPRGGLRLAAVGC